MDRIEWRRRPPGLLAHPTYRFPLPSFLDWAQSSADLAVIRRQKGISTPITEDCKQNEV